MIYCLLAKGFEEIEAVTTVDILRRAGIDVETVAISKLGGEVVVGAHGMNFIADIKQKDIDYDKIDGVFLPGGMPGTLNLEKSKTVQNVIEHCYKNDKYIFAICAAPQILGHKGYLNGKDATCYPGFEGELTGADIVDAPAVLDGKILTGKGPGVTIEFALAIVEILKGADTAQKLRESMQCQ